MKIYIPTLGREGKQIALEMIPDSWKDRVFIVCPKEEKHNWKNRINVPKNCIGSICKTRQWICDMSDDPLIGMIDDDVRFYKRDDVILTKRTLCTKKQVEQLFNLMEKWLESGEVFCGTSNSFMSQNKPKEYFYGKPSHVFFLNRDYLKEHNIRYDVLQYYSDFHIPLSILECGKRLRYTGVFISKEYKPNGAGGCSINRTAEKNRLSLIKLSLLHKPYITLKEDEEGKNQTLNIGLKMRIAFKKLYEDKVLKKNARRGYDK